MSSCCCLPLLECVYCLGCVRWVWKKFLYTAGSESENWGLASAEEFDPVPRICRYILAVYEDDLRNPIWAPPGGYRMNPDWVVLRRTDEETQGKVAPYIIYLDHDNSDIVLAIRGLNMAKETDFLVLLDDKLGQTKFDGGYVHTGLLKSAEWVWNTEYELLKELTARNPSYTLTFAGHSLGAGVVALLAMLAVQNRAKLGNIERKMIRCFAIAPARCVSLNLAVRYADVTNSIVLQVPMSSCCCLPLLECVYCLGCVRWVWKKFLYTAGSESENWGLASAEEFDPVPRICRYILAVYEDDLRNPIWAPPGGYRMNPDWVVLRRTDEETQGKVAPYIIYLDHDNSDIVLAIRGLNMAKETDFLVLLDDKLGQTKFDGGYVHTGLLKSAEWVWNTEYELLKELTARNPSYTLTFAGHSLGAGVVALLAMLAVQNRAKLGNIERKMIRCFAIAPARCVSLNLAVRYADVTNSIVLQDTCTLPEERLRDPRRLYAPGRLYHIVDRKPFRMGKVPPIVRTAVPVDGRFEHIVLSCNVLSDHGIIWVERESQRALELMKEEEKTTEIPPQQKMERQASLAKEHSEEYEAALRRAVALDVPQAFSPSSYGTFNNNEIEEGDDSTRLGTSVSPSRRKENWDDFVDRVFDVDDESGEMVLKKW